MNGRDLPVECKWPFSSPHGRAFIHTHTTTTCTYALNRARERGIRANGAETKKIRACRAQQAAKAVNRPRARAKGRD